MPWAWGGEGRPRSPGGYWAAGDDVIGDPPHEPQGWYSVFDADAQAGGEGRCLHEEDSGQAG